MSESKTEIVTREESDFALAQRKAKVLSLSSLAPKDYHGNVANCLIAMELAERLHAAPLMVMQNVAIIHGRPAMSASFLIATVNSGGRFTALRYETVGDDPHDKGYRCRAVAIERETGERCDGEWIDWRMVNGEGWAGKSGSKWKTMPGQMFRYRAATFWCRSFCPEVAMGMSTQDEVEDIAAPVARTITAARWDAPPLAPAEPQDAPQSQQAVRGGGTTSAPETRNSAHSGARGVDFTGGSIQDAVMDVAAHLGCGVDPLLADMAQALGKGWVHVGDIGEADEAAAREWLIAEVQKEAR